MLYCHYLNKAALLGAALFLAACLPLRDEASVALVESEQHGFMPVPLTTDVPGLRAVLQPGHGVLSVYIEGDGAPWSTRHHPPADPTPWRSTVFSMARQDVGAVAYLARPCQYLTPEQLTRCPVAWWTDQRFAAHLVDSLNQAVDSLKRRAGVERIRLIGYSGGGVMATLIAARRGDVVSLVTVAAPLDLAAWTRHHDISPVVGAETLAALRPDQLPPAWHFAGEQDAVVPPAIVAGFARRTGGKFETVAGNDHVCCWAEQWPALLEKTR